MEINIKDLTKFNWIDDSWYQLETFSISDYNTKVFYDDAKLNEGKYEYKVYADRSDNSDKYATNLVIDGSYETHNNYYMNNWNDYCVADQLNIAAIISACTNKFVILNTGKLDYCCIIYSNFDEELRNKFDRLLRANIFINGVELENITKNIIAIDDEYTAHRFLKPDGNMHDSLYERSILVYSYEKKSFIDVLVVTNNMAKEDTNIDISYHDNMYSHRFVVERLPIDNNIDNMTKIFLNKYSSNSSIIVHYGGDENKNPLLESYNKVNIAKLYNTYNKLGIKNKKLREIFIQLYPKLYFLNHRAFDDCIATILIALTMPIHKYKKILFNGLRKCNYKKAKNIK